MGIFDRLKKPVPEVQIRSAIEETLRQANAGPAEITIFAHDGVLGITVHGDLDINANLVLRGKHRRLETCRIQNHEPGKLRGVGRKTLEALETVARENGCRIAVADSVLRKTGVEDFWESAGYNPEVQGGRRFVKKI